MTPKQEQAIIKHGEQINSIFHTGLDPIVLIKKLRRIEGAAHKLAEDACNYLSMDSPEFATREAALWNRIHTILPVYPKIVFINLDPRGYALKIDDEYMRKHNLQLYRDFGGYGILAPEFDKNGN